MDVACKIWTWHARHGMPAALEWYGIFMTHSVASSLGGITYELHEERLGFVWQSQITSRYAAQGFILGTPSLVLRAPRGARHGVGLEFAQRGCLRGTVTCLDRTQPGERGFDVRHAQTGL